MTICTNVNIARSELASIIIHKSEGNCGHKSSFIRNVSNVFLYGVPIYLLLSAMYE
jgi:hypothetical protein